MAVRVEDVFSAEPISGPLEQEQLIAYLQRQFQGIQAAFQLGFAQNIRFLTVAPTRPQEGLLVGADGTFWNPGAGKGVYVYYSGVWNKLG